MERSKEKSDQWSQHESRKKKSKKEKKSKKHKSKKNKKKSSDSEDSASDGMEWVEVTAETKTKEVQRESWMCEETFVPTLSKEEILAKDPNYRKKVNNRDKNQNDYKPGEHERELNPYWKNSGKGVPEACDNDSSDVKLSSSSVGDGGLSWLKKAYERIEQQAKEQGRSMEDVAAERWGSLEKLIALIDEAEERMKSKAHGSHRYNERYHSRHESKQGSQHWHQEHHASSRKSEKEHYVPSKRSEKDQEVFSEQKVPVTQKILNPLSEKQRGKTSAKEFNVFKRPSFLDDDIDAGSVKKSYSKEMFSRPCLEYSDGKEAHRSSSASSDTPAWKKKKALTKPALASNEQAKGTEDDGKITDSGHSRLALDSEVSLTKVTEEPVSMTDDEMNKLAAKILKAEMKGDIETAAQLQTKLDAAWKSRKAGFSAAVLREKEKEEVVLCKFDRHGVAVPLVAPSSSVNTSRKGQQKRAASRSQMGKVQKYFSDESEHSLKSMFEREKLTTADDQLEMFIDVAVEDKYHTDRDYETGDISAKATRKMGYQRQDEKDYNHAIQDHKRLSTALERCDYCFEKIKKHLVIVDSKQAYICLPSCQSLTDGHCFIVPKAHISSSLLLEEDIAEEIEKFKKLLTNMFRESDQCLVFVETSMNLRYRPHLVIECFPLPSDMREMAPMYFKKAIQEQGSEWANNIKLIDLFKKGLRHSVPKGLPFFAVEFSTGGGYAHIIEDKDFSKHFGKEIVGGMLEIDSHLCSRYRKEDFKEQSKKVLHFTKMWKSYISKNDIAI